MSAATRRTLVAKIVNGKIEVIVNRPGFITGRLAEPAPKTAGKPRRR